MTFISYAQNNEDVMLWRALKHVSNGFYIDVGANDPVVDSITKSFYDRGWRGINIEPLKKHWEDLKKERPFDNNIQCAVGKLSREIEIWECDVRGWGTAAVDVINTHQKNGLIGKYHKVKCVTLTEICEQSLIGEINFLKIDVEGFENEVIEGMDFSRFRPWVLVIEGTRPGSTEDSYCDWEGAILGAGYEFSYTDGVNRFYVAREHSELKVTFKNPPNVFDNFVRYEHLMAETRAQEAEARAQEAEARAQQAEARAQQAEARAQQAEARPTAMKPVSNTKSGLTIAVDVTPILPGGENGGAKVFTLELLRQLADLERDLQLVLLTQSASHDELAYMDRENIRRVMVLDATGVESKKKFLEIKDMVVKIIDHFPHKLRRYINVLNSKLKRRLQKVELRDFFSGFEADLLFCPFTAPTYHNCERPTVCVIYDLQYKTYPQFFANEEVEHREYAFVEACRKATFLATISNFSRDCVIKYGNVPQEKIKTIYLRMAGRFRTKNSELGLLLAEFGLHQKKYLVYPANFWAHKNHEMLIASFGVACHNGLSDDIKLVLTGAPNEKQARLKFAAKAHGLCNRIVFTDYLSDDQLFHVLHNSLAVIYPSLYEGFGMPVLEAMQLGVPVACSDLTSLPEIVLDAALTFNPKVPLEIASAIQKVASDDAVRGNLVRKGKVRSLNFLDSRRMAVEYLALFKEALVIHHGAV